MPIALFPFGINFLGKIFLGIFSLSILLLLENSSMHKAHQHLSLSSNGLTLLVVIYCP
jgi:hypothetical protein